MDDGKRAAQRLSRGRAITISMETVANRRSESKRVTGTSARGSGVSIRASRVEIVIAAETPPPRRRTAAPTLPQCRRNAAPTPLHAAFTACSRRPCTAPTRRQNASTPPQRHRNTIFTPLHAALTPSSSPCTPLHCLHAPRTPHTSPYTSPPHRRNATLAPLHAALASHTAPAPLRSAPAPHIRTSRFCRSAAANDFLFGGRGPGGGMGPERRAR